MGIFGRIAAQTNANGRLQSPVSSVEGRDVCSFCQEPIGQYDTQIGHRVLKIGFKRCTCAGAVEYWQQEDARRAQERADIERMERRKRIDDLFAKSLIPERWKNRTFKAYQVSQNNQEAYRGARRFAEEFDEHPGDGLLLTGSNGTGKTHLAAAVSLYLLAREHSVVFGTAASLLSQVKSTFDSDKVTEQDMMRRFLRCDLLVIDELGKEKVTDWGIQVLYEIINGRYEHNKALIITTNLKLPQIRERYNQFGMDAGNAMVDRAFEVLRGIEMRWESYRVRNLG